MNFAIFLLFISLFVVNSYDHMKNNFKTMMKHLGLLIKTERKKRGLTQTQLGDISGTSINFISQIEAGKETAHIGKVFRVLQILGLELVCQRGSQGLIIPTEISQ